jgi:DNA-binding transcriptional ArsR family regulator
VHATEQRQEILDDARRVRVALAPLRRQLLGLLAQPDSATGFARRLKLLRQKINNQLRALEREGLVELVEERQRRGLKERRLQVAARAWLIDPSLLAEHGLQPAEFQDRFASAYLVATAAPLARDVAALGERAQVVQKRLATVTLEAEVTLASPRELRIFAAELQSSIAELTVRYQRAGGRRYRLVVAAHPARAQEERHDERERSMENPEAEAP